MQCLFWMKDCHYIDKAVEIPKQAREHFIWEDREQYMGDDYRHIPFVVCNHCMLDSANDYGTNTEEHWTIKSKAGIFLNQRASADKVLGARWTREGIIEKLKEVHEEYTRARHTMNMQHKIMQSLELAFKRILEKDKGY